MNCYNKIENNIYYLVLHEVIPCYKVVYHNEVMYISIINYDEIENFYPDQVPTYDKNATTFFDKKEAKKYLLKQNINDIEQKIKELSKQLGEYYNKLEKLEEIK